METIKDTIKEQSFKLLKVQKLNSGSSPEIFSIFLEKGAEFTENGSPREAHIIVLEGMIDLFINKKVHHLSTHQHFQLRKETPHWIEAVNDSKFLVIR